MILFVSGLLLGLVALPTLVILASKRDETDWDIVDDRDESW